MLLSDFDFNLPKELIAQHPQVKRDHSDLLVACQEKIEIVKFYNLINYLQPGDLLVFNDSRVINAKLEFHKGGKIINLNLIKKINDNCWSAFAKPGKLLLKDDRFFFENHCLIIEDKMDSGEIIIRFDLDQINVFDFLNKYGQVPLPQYIKRQEPSLNQSKQDQIRYQNVYSKHLGSVAAPTAGLHFSDELLENIRKKQIETVFVTLHVGAGTFLPVKVENIKEHKMHSEWCEISQDAAQIINKAKKEQRRIIVVGTTALRTIESFAKNNIIYPGVIDTDIFITPGYKFQIADYLITNFHLPKSTLFMLVCAFSGYQEMKDLYQYAINKKMRFFSYGDATIIKRKT